MSGGRAQGMFLYKKFREGALYPSRAQWVDMISEGVS